MAVTTSSNPISSVAPTSNPISSIAPPAYPPSNQNNNNALLTRLHLDLRGQRFVVERETLMNLPESVLLCLFPNGLVLSRQYGVGAGQGLGEGDEEEEVYGVDYDPQCFRFVLEFWSTAQNTFYNPSSATSPSPFQSQQTLLFPSSSDPSQSLYSPSDSQGPQDNPLITKQPIIVLREELEYFTILPPSQPPKGGVAHPLAAAQTTGPKGSPTPELQRLKKLAGNELLERRKVFTALQRNVSKEGNLAEQHLIDMLCMSGFSREDTWGYRALEPTRCCISSIALVLLKTGIIHDGSGGVTVDQNQMATAQKLLLFWRKPARKCWWDGVQVEIPVTDGSGAKTASVKVWSRRVWTLELSLVDCYTQDV